jgi:hypothetical protein
VIFSAVKLSDVSDRKPSIPIKIMENHIVDLSRIRYSLFPMRQAAADMFQVVAAMAARRRSSSSILLFTLQNTAPLIREYGHFRCARLIPSYLQLRSTL